MDIATLKTFFMWCTIVNVGLLSLSVLACTALKDFAYRMNNMMFSISKETFNIVVFSFMAIYKIFIMVFNLVPYIALVIIENTC
jgi:uncharacterized membrane protein YqjE